MLYQGPEFERIAQHAQLLTLIDASLGRGAVIGSLSSIKRGPGPGQIPLHTDYSIVPEPYPEFALTGVGVWAFEDWSVASGPTWIIPGVTEAPVRGASDSKEAACRPDAQGLGRVLHARACGTGRASARSPEIGSLCTRTSTAASCAAWSRRVDVQMMHRNPPRLGEMLGEDDWFDKLGRTAAISCASDTDQLHAFTEKRKRELLAGA